ncbi:hypothetical protein OD997_06200 [Microbacterium sp. CGR1]
MTARGERKCSPRMQQFYAAQAAMAAMRHQGRTEPEQPTLFDLAELDHDTKEPDHDHE